MVSVSTAPLYHFILTLWRYINIIIIIIIIINVQTFSGLLKMYLFV